MVREEHERKVGNVFFGPPGIFFSPLIKKLAVPFNGSADHKSRETNLVWYIFDSLARQIRDPLINLTVLISAEADKRTSPPIYSFFAYAVLAFLLSHLISHIKAIYEHSEVPSKFCPNACIMDCKPTMTSSSCSRFVKRIICVSAPARAVRS